MAVFLQFGETSTNPVTLTAANFPSGLNTGNDIIDTSQGLIDYIH